MRIFIKRTLSLVLILAMIVSVCPQMQGLRVDAADKEEPYCISKGRPVYVSSGTGEENLVDDNFSTRWESSHVNVPQWVYIDLGKKADIDHMYLEWEAAYAKSYKIQFSDDEENWRDVYIKGNAGGNQQETSREQTGISITYKNITKTVGGRDVTGIQASWTSVENAQYKVCVNTEDNVATAFDGYKFNSHGPSQGEIALEEGEYTLIVIALDKTTKQEVGRGQTKVIVSREEISTTGKDGETQPVVDEKKQTIDFSNLSEQEKQARYVRIYMTEKALPAYGYSLFEVQIFGTNGVVKRDDAYGTNLALHKTVESSGHRDEWWMKDENGDYREGAVENVWDKNAVDGSKSTSWTSYQGDNQWIYVDLEQPYSIGRVVINWTTDGGKIYDIQVSADAQSWKTVARNQKGYAGFVDDRPLYAENVRYVRIYGYTRVESGSGFGISELEVYEYREGDEKTTYTIDPLPTTQIINSPTGKGSYVTGQMYNEKNKLPTFINKENIDGPVDSNSWWTSAIVQKFSNLLCVMPYKAKFSGNGLGILTATSGWVGERGLNDLGTDQRTEEKIDFYVQPDNYDKATGYDRVEDYGDYSVQLGLWDANGMKMKTTFTKGSPYLFNEFCDTEAAYINSSTLEEIFDGNGNSILKNEGDSIVTDHIGFKSMDEENTKANNNGSYYLVNVPEGTKFKVLAAEGSYKIKVTFPSVGENYMSVAAMTDKSDLNTYYRHGYAFVTDTAVDYVYDRVNSKITTNYTVTTKTMRSGFAEETMQCMLPHQWKHAKTTWKQAALYRSVRGDMKGIWSNQFSTVQQFAGLLPTFATPGSKEFNSTECMEYLDVLDSNTANLNPVSDAYWEGKNVHPLAMGVLMADQLGEAELRQKFLNRLKKIMKDWFTWDGENDRCYLIYNKDWGTVYYPDSAYGANAAICDHHFTYGYFMFGAAVLSTYDKDFMNDYKYMIELLVRDYADPKEPEEDENMFCKFRAFDQYAGHSWAGGYGDSDSGNNQESASEALFSWVGMYLWGEATQNDTYIDAGAYGFTTEMDAVEQYWFDYGETNWLGDDPQRDGQYDYPFEAAGQIYGASMGYGTYFGGQPTYVFGIQWLPVSEYLTNYGMDQERCAKIYAGLEYDTQYAIDIETRLAAARGEEYDPNSYVTPDNGWQHITWPFLSQTDPARALEKFKKNVSGVQREDRANTFWFLTAMDQLGYRTNDYVITGNITGSVYYNEKTKTYTAEVWNPTETAQTVTVIDANEKKVGTAKIGARALVSFEIDTNDFALTQVSTPVMKAVSLADGVVTDHINGEETFDDTQLIELTCEDSDAVIYYSTDGSVPTTDSQVYQGKILVSSDTVVKAIAVKDGYIHSAYAATAIKINGDKVESSENLALYGTAYSSSDVGANTADKANDGSQDTRWESKSENDEWFTVDLGATYAVNTVKINWEAAYASKYDILVSTDKEHWEKVTTESGSRGEVTTSFAAVKARYVKMQGVSRATAYGYSLYEFEVYGALQAKAPTITPVSGVYENEQTVTMSTAVKGAEIKYTLDGSLPTETSATYTGPITISKATIVKAVTYRKGMILSDVTESSIIIAGTLSLNASELSVAIGNKKQLSAITDETVTWSSNDDTTASVDQTGLVTGINKGTAVITASIPNGQKATCTVTVTDPIPISSVSMSKKTLEMKNKTSETLQLLIDPENTTDDTTVTWECDDDSIVSVNNNGTVTAKKEGTATITATVGSFSDTCEIVVGPAATLEEMMKSAKYNLSLKKNVTVSSIYSGEGSQDPATLVNGNLTDSYVCTDWDNNLTSDYIIVDLGKTYAARCIDTIGMQFKSDAGTFSNDYEIQYSTNGVDFVTVMETHVNYEDTESGLFAIEVGNQTEKIEAVRFVKVILKGHKNWGYQIREISILNTELDVEEVEVPHCELPEDFTVASEKYGQITYTITSGDGKEDYRYLVYLNGAQIGNLVEAGTHTIEDLDAGVYKVTIIAYSNHLLSEEITREVMVDDGSLKEFVNTSRNLAKDCDITVEDIYEKEGNQNPKTLVDGNIAGDVVETNWGTQNAVITMDLKNSYNPDQMEEVLIAFKNDKASFCNHYTISFSDDGKNYEQVAEINNKKFKTICEHKIDSSAYTRATVRYVKIEFAGSSYNYGYHMHEIAVFGNGDFMPAEPEGVSVTSPQERTIVVSWMRNENGQLYNVYIDDVIKSTNVTAGSYQYYPIDAGEHQVKVTSVLNGIESAGVVRQIAVKGGLAPQPTTPPPTTPQPTTPQPTTPQPTPSTTPQPPTTNPPPETVDETPSDRPTQGGSDMTMEGPKNETDTTEQSGVETTADRNGQDVADNEVQTVKVGKTKVKSANKKRAAKKVKISLKKIKGATAYQIQISKNKKFKQILLTQKVKKYKFHLKSKKIQNQKKLYLRARAICQVKKRIYYGKWSKKKKIKIKK